MRYVSTTTVSLLCRCNLPNLQLRNACVRVRVFAASSALTPNHHHPSSTHVNSAIRKLVGMMNYALVASLLVASIAIATGQPTDKFYMPGGFSRLWSGKPSSATYVWGSNSSMIMDPPTTAVHPATGKSVEREGNVRLPLDPDIDLEYNVDDAFGHIPSLIGFYG